LAEALIVLGLIGIMASGAVPGMHRIQQEWMLFGATRVVESSLLWGRMRAIAANDALIFMVDDDGRRCYWQEVDGTRIESTVRALPAGVRIASAPRKPLRFYQHGNAVPSGTFLVQGTAGSYRVVVSVQGRIRTQRDD
jgi:Tfp pilus assembly protein FimT